MRPVEKLGEIIPDKEPTEAIKDLCALLVAKCMTLFWCEEEGLPGSIAGVLDVVKAITVLSDVRESVRSAMAAKFAERGGFLAGNILESMED
jgi:hypothetical protein